jgi:hypothetical protein
VHNLDETHHVDAQLFDDNDDDDGPSATLFPSLPKWVVATLINYKFSRKSFGTSFQVDSNSRLISTGPSHLHKYHFSPPKTLLSMINPNEDHEGFLRERYGLL